MITHQTTTATSVVSTEEIDAVSALATGWEATVSGAPTYTQPSGSILLLVLSPKGPTEPRGK